MYRPGSNVEDPERRSLQTRVRLRLARQVLPELCQRPRIWKYRALSSARLEGAGPILHQPALFIGHGTVRLAEGVQFGWRDSPLFYAGYCQVEVSTQDALFEVGPRTEFNNNLFVKSEGAGIRIGRDGLFGANIEIFDSNFHDLDPGRRHEGTPKLGPVEIGDNVFIGMGVKILKGVQIGSDTVVGAGSVVSTSLPAGVVAAGNPARVIREL